MTVTGPSPSIALQRRDGVWEKLGTAVGGYGVVPESIQWVHSVSQGGPTSLTFVLHQDPRRKRNDLEQFTPVSCKMGSEDEWSGRVIALSTARGADNTINVECEGWYQHTKDWSYPKIYAHRDLSKWQDGLSMNGGNPSSFSINASRFSNAGGEVTLSGGKGDTVTTLLTWGQAILDLGPNNVAKRIVASYYGNVAGAGTNATLYARSASLPDLLNPGSYTDAFTDNTITTTPETTAGTFSTGYRYVILSVYYTGATATLGADYWLKFTDVQVYTATAYESGNASVLKASDVVADVLTNRCPLVSSDQSLITATSFSIPAYAPDPGRFPNEHIDAVNSYHGWNFYMTPEPTPRAVYEALPTVPSYALGAGDSYKFTAPAERNGRETYSQVTLAYQDATGIPGWTTANIPTASTLPVNATQLANPSFDTDNSNWTVESGSLTRDTVVFDSSPASGRLNSAGDGKSNVHSAQVTLSANFSYRLTMRYRREATITGSGNAIQIEDSNNTALTSANAYTVTDVNAMTLSTWTSLTIDFVAPINGIVRLTVNTNGPISSLVGYFDSISIAKRSTGPVSYRGFVRELIVSPSGPLTSAAATQIAQTILDARQLPPLKGTLEAPEGVREPLTGRRVPPWSVRSGKAIILEDEQDPNAGAFGRIGVVQTASYNHDTRTVTMEVDSATDFVDNLLARIAAK